MTSRSEDTDSIAADPAEGTDIELYDIRPTSTGSRKLSGQGDPFGPNRARIWAMLCGSAGQRTERIS
jgi:hypothetical protein